jgi:hypothetical protein
VLRQLGIIVAIVVVWAGLFAGYLGAVGVQVPTPVAERPKATRGPTRTPLATFLPTSTPTVVASVTPAASSTLPIASPVAGETRPVPTPTSVPATASRTPVSATPTSKPAASVSFSRDVQPILDRVCVKCHGGEKTEEALVLKTYSDLMEGSDNGPVIAPGNSKDSLLIDLITQGKMPKKGPKLLPAEIRIITQWVDAGAPNN